MAIQGSPPPPSLDALLARPMTPPAPDVLAAIESGPMSAEQALPCSDVDRLLDPAPMEVETGWCTLPDGIGHVAVRTPMPDVTGAMLDWWFDWHPHADVRYRIWHPRAHRSVRWSPPRNAPEPGDRPYWGTVHRPVEDLGLGDMRVRIAFVAPAEIGLPADALDRPGVETILAAFSGDDRLRVQSGPMVHVLLDTDEGRVLRSRFWLGADARPYLPEPLGSIGGRLINRPVVRRRAIDARLPKLLARHCAEEFANLATLVPELHPHLGSQRAGAA
jgi:hypothetical protein